MRLNLISPVNNLGYGLVGLNVLKAAIRAGVQVAWWPIGPAEAHPKDHESLRAPFEAIQFFEKTAPCLRIWHQNDMAQMVGKGLHAGLPIFELDRFTEAEQHHLRTLDVVIAPSSWAAQVLRQNGVENVAVAPFGVDTSLFNTTPPECMVAPVEASTTEKVDVFQSSPEGATTFFNIGKWEVRKGHDVLVKAFNLAFSRSDNVRLVMACHNPFLEKGVPTTNADWAAYYLNSVLGKAGKITVFNRRLPEQENIAALIHKCDVGVFPARAEGWNMEALESLACGKWVIATNYSAHTEYLTACNSSLIKPTGLENAVDGIWFKGQGRWAELGRDQLDQLVEYLRAAHRLKQSGCLPVNTAGLETAKRFTWDRTWSYISDAIQSRQ